MNHLEKFKERNLKKEDPKKIAKIIFDYFEESNGDEGDHFWNMMDILMEAYYPGEPEFSDYLSYDEILVSVSNLLSERISKGHHRYIYKDIYNSFVDIYQEIEKIMLSIDFLKTEEIEDYFLGIDYKYTIKRSKMSKFIVSIESVNSNDVISIFNRIWMVINSRLPKNYFISDIFVIKISIDENDIEITISNSFSSI